MMKWWHAKGIFHRKKILHDKVAMDMLKSNELAILGQLTRTKINNQDKDK